MTSMTDNCGNPPSLCSYFRRTVFALGSATMALCNLCYPSRNRLFIATIQSSLLSIATVTYLFPQPAHSNVITDVVGLSSYTIEVQHTCHKSFVLGIHYLDARSENWETWWRLFIPDETAAGKLVDYKNDDIVTDESGIYYYIEVAESLIEVLSPHVFAPKREQYVAQVGPGTTGGRKSVTTPQGATLTFLSYRDLGYEFDMDIVCHNEPTELEKKSKLCKRAISLKASICGYDCEQDYQLPESRRSCIDRCRSDYFPSTGCAQEVEDLTNDHISRDILLPESNSDGGEETEEDGEVRGYY